MSYDMIDRFLRNNLGDDDYAEYSAALDSLVQPAQPQPTDPRITALEARCKDYGEALNSVISAMTLGIGDTEKQQNFCEVPKSLLKTVQKVLAKHGGAA